MRYLCVLLPIFRGSGIIKFLLKGDYMKVFEFIVAPLYVVGYIIYSIGYFTINGLKAAARLFE